MAYENNISSSDVFEKFKDAWVGEIEQDLIDLNAAKPELTTIFIGPPRVENVDLEKTDVAEWIKVNKGLAEYKSNNELTGLIPLGAVQVISYGTSRQQIPLGFVGTSQKTFASSDSTFGQGAIQNLVAPKNFLKLVNDYISNIKGYIGRKDESGYTVLEDLDTILGEIPFGLAIVKYNKLKKPISKDYLEMVKLNSVSKSIAAGQAVIFESISFVYHRSVPLGVNPEG